MAIGEGRREDTGTEATVAKLRGDKKGARRSGAPTFCSGRRALSGGADRSTSLLLTAGGRRRTWRPAVYTAFCLSTPIWVGDAVPVGRDFVEICSDPRRPTTADALGDRLFILSVLDHDKSEQAIFLGAACKAAR